MSLFKLSNNPSQNLTVEATKFKEIKKGNKRSILFLAEKAVLEGECRIVSNDLNREEVLADIWKVEYLSLSNLTHQHAKSNGFENLEQMLLFLKKKGIKDYSKLTQVSFLLKEEKSRFVFLEKINKKTEFNL